MRKGLAIPAAVGLASAAGAQSVEIEPGAATVAPGEAAPLTVFGDPGPGDYAIAGIEFRVDATGGAWADNQHHILPTAAPGSALNPGTIEGSSVVGILVGQLDGFGFTPEPGRIRLWSAEFSSAAEGVFDITTTTSRMAVYADNPRGEPWPWRTVTPTEGHARVTVIPAPAGLALLALGGLAVGRRGRDRSRRPLPWRPEDR